MDLHVFSMIACLVIGYLLGGLSPSFLIGKLKGYDVRDSGTGNAGASNTVILAGNLAGALVAAVDILKSFAACLICMALFSTPIAGILGGVAAILGHMFPWYLGFRGGKGLACIGGVILAMEPGAFLPLVAVAFGIIFLTKAPSLVAPVISVAWPAFYGIRTSHWLGAVVLAVPAIPVIIKHVPNFKRIATGEELRMRFLWKREEELRRIRKK